MAYEILSESYGRRLPKIAAEADSADDLATLGTNWAEGSTCIIGDTTYKLDKVQGWVEPGSGGGGGGSVFKVTVTQVGEGREGHLLLDKNYTEIKEALEAGSSVYAEFDTTTGEEIGVLTGLMVSIGQDEYDTSYWGATFALPNYAELLFSAGAADEDLKVSLG